MKTLYLELCEARGIKVRGEHEGQVNFSEDFAYYDYFFAQEPSMQLVTKIIDIFVIEQARGDSGLRSSSFDDIERIKGGYGLFGAMSCFKE